MTTYRPQALTGPWIGGYALDLHTLSSVYTGDNEYGHPTFDTEYSDLGALMKSLKYSGDRAALGPIIHCAADWVRKWNPGVDLVIGVPPSKHRAFQPVPEIAKGLGTALGLPFCPRCVVKATGSTEVKSLESQEEREDALHGAHRFAVGEGIAGRNVLLVDDLYRSGTTLRAITDGLGSVSRVNTVHVLTITKTRSKK